MLHSGILIALSAPCNACRHQDAVTASKQKEDGIREGVALMQGRARRRHAGVFPTLLVSTLYHVLHNVAARVYSATIRMHKAVSYWRTPVTDDSGQCDDADLRQVSIQLPHKYNHPRYFNSCLFALSEVLLKQLLAAISLSPFFSLLADSSTDISGEDHILIYIQYINMETFVPTVQYLCTVIVAPKTADMIYAVLIKVLDILSIPVNKLVGFCSDGGSEYSGRNNGVAAQLKSKICPYLVYSHCAAHKVALVMSDQAKTTVDNADIDVADLMDRPVFDGDAAFSLKVVDNIIRSVHSLFAHSSKRLRQWHTYAAPFGVTRFKFQVYNATRWWSRYTCLQVLVLNMVVFMGFLKSHQEGWHAAQQLLLWFRNPNTLALIFVMHDVMNIMNVVNVAFQSATVLPHHIKPLIDQTTTKLAACVALGDDGSLTYSAEHMPSLASFVTCFKYKNGVGVWSTTRKGKPLLICMEPKVDLKLDACLQFAYNLCTSIIRSMCSRFEHLSVLNAFKIFDPSFYAGMSKTAVQQDSFGLADYQVLTTHFARTSLAQRLFDVPADIPWTKVKKDGKVVSGVTSGMKQLREEYKAFKMVMHSYALKHKNATMSDAWVHLHAECSVKFPRVTKLALVALSLPTNSAVVERGFTFHGWFKNEHSNCIRLVTLDSKMRVKLCVPEDCDFMDGNLISPACDLLMASGLSDEQKPPLLSVLYQTACGVQVPKDFVEAFDGTDPCADIDVLQLGSDDDADSLKYDSSEDSGSSSEEESSNGKESSSDEESSDGEEDETEEDRAFREAMQK